MHATDKFHPGDKVQLATGEGPVMVIERKSDFEDDEWVCTYWQETSQTIITKYIQAAALIKLPADTKK